MLQNIKSCKKTENDRSKNLLIIGAGIYSVVAQEIAESMNIFNKIDFLDDNAEFTPNGIKVLGKSSELEKFESEYGKAFVAIGNAKVRLSLLDSIKKTSVSAATLISPFAYISPSAKIEEGSIIEPMAVIHSGVEINRGCIISAGAVVNHASTCCEGVHIDCNAVVSGNAVVPQGLKVESGTVFKDGK